MECRRCGAENASGEGYCRSCASPLADPHKRGRLGVDQSGPAVRLLSGLAKAFAKSLILLALLILSTTAIVGLYDYVAGHRMLAGLGLTLTGVGCVLAFASALTLSRIPKAIAIVKYPMLSTGFTPLWKSMRFGSPRGEANLSITLMIAGLGMFIAGLLLL